MLLGIVFRFKTLLRNHARKVNRKVIEKLGFTALQVNSALQPPLYHLRDAAGTTHDNNGMGFSSTLKARKEAERLRLFPKAPAA